LPPRFRLTGDLQRDLQKVRELSVAGWIEVTVSGQYPLGVSGKERGGVDQLDGVAFGDRLE
jgi:hypothetical protein